MLNEFSRTELLLGKDGAEKLSKSRVALFGVGGVGGYCAEALARSGVGEIHLIDSDKVSVTNINRQIIATQSSLGKLKTQVMRERINDINPACTVVCHDLFFTEDCTGLSDFSAFDFVVDAIDTVSGKIAVITRAKAAGTPVISCMGAGNKLDPTKFQVIDIYKTTDCPLARVMRRELKKRGVTELKTVFSSEPPVKFSADAAEESGKVIGSVSFVPPVAGLIAAGEVIKYLAGVKL